MSTPRANWKRSPFKGSKTLKNTQFHMNGNKRRRRKQPPPPRDEEKGSESDTTVIEYETDSSSDDDPPPRPPSPLPHRMWCCTAARARQAFIECLVAVALVCWAFDSIATRHELSSWRQIPHALGLVR